MPRSKPRGQHVQGWADTSAMGTIVEWLAANGQQPQSVSHLVGLVFDTLADVIVQNGGTALSGIDALQAIERIWNKPITPRLQTGNVQSTQSTQAVSKEAVMLATRMYEQTCMQALHGESIVASESDDGEYSSAALRAQERVTRQEELDKPQ